MWLMFSLLLPVSCKLQLEMKVSLKIPVLALLLIFVEYGFAQPSGKMDSLITAFHKSKADTVRVEVITNMGFLFEGENPDSSLHFYIKAASYIDSCKGSMWIGKAVKQKLLLKGQCTAKARRDIPNTWRAGKSHRLLQPIPLHLYRAK